MNSVVAVVAEGDEVLIAIVPLLAAELLMVNLEAGHSPAGLAAPPITL
jgi:hypothetical protein